MPRRRSPPNAGRWPGVSSSSCSRSGSSAMKPRDDGFTGGYLLANRRLDLGVERQVHVHARAEADEAEALAPRELAARANIAQDAPRNQPGDLHAGDVLAIARMQPDGVALVRERCLVECRVHERA